MENIKDRCVIISSAMCGDDECEQTTALYCDDQKEKFKKELKKVIAKYPDGKVSSDEFEEVVDQKWNLLFLMDNKIPYIKITTKKPEYGNDVFSIYGSVDDVSINKKWVSEW